MSQIVGLPDALARIRDVGRAAIFYATATGSDNDTAPIKWAEANGNPLFVKWLEDTEGEVVCPQPNEVFNALTAPELTAEAALKAYRMGNAPTVTMPIVWADPTLRSIMSSTGSASDGYNRPRPVDERTFMVSPEELFYNAATKAHDLTLTWSTGEFVLTDPEAQVVPLTGRKLELLGLCTWLWRCYVRIPQTRFRIEEGGKSIEPAEAHVMIDAEKPNGHLLYTVGNPFTAGIFIDGSES